MGSMEEQLRNKGFAPKYKKEDRGRKQRSNYDFNKKYRDNLIRNFGDSYINLILSAGENNYNNFINQIKSYIEKNNRNITTSQLRNIFSRIKSIKNVSEVWRLRPNLAYIAGRSDKDSMKELVFLLDELIQNIGENDTKKLSNFIDFFESIIAYHKFFGGK